ncbi:MAG TPA: cob(I)yrinic acid a,c-diamide adenosyltransferase [Thermodesulfobacteriota bacterium]|nr:cob(I)yrinic acid a,c-diamide adenosyltransferase [Thermodesulfobacteriota bacterium]
MKFSKLGDEGLTSLMGGQRVPKWGERPEAYGTLDEASSALGLARALAAKGKTREILLHVQKELVTLGAELATLPEDAAKYPYRIGGENVQGLEKRMTELQSEVDLPPEFVYPGGTPAGAAIDLGRTMIRRAERRCAALAHSKTINNPEVLRFLNRLADLLFVLARYEEFRAAPCTP